MFLESGEKIKAVLGTVYLLRFLDCGIPERGFGVVTEKRVYFHGKCFYKSNGNYRERKEEYIIDVREIVATGFSAIRLPILFFLCMLLAFLSIGVSFLAVIAIDKVRNYNVGVEFLGRSYIIMFLLALAAVCLLYYIKKFRVFEIEYSGGKIAFLTEFYTRAEVEAFQQSLFRAKEEASFSGKSGSGISGVAAPGKSAAAPEFAETPAASQERAAAVGAGRA